MRRELLYLVNKGSLTGIVILYNYGQTDVFICNISGTLDACILEHFYAVLYLPGILIIFLCLHTVLMFERFASMV